MTSDIEPLSAALWFDRIEMIARGELGTVERSLRHAAHLLQLAPSPFRPIVRLTIDEADFEELLEAGDLDTAARHLVAEPAALSVHLDSNGTTRAAITCPIQKRAIEGAGDTVAEAVLSAWTSCLLGLRDEFGEELPNLESSGRHKGRSEPLRLLS